MSIDATLVEHHDGFMKIKLTGAAGTTNGGLGNLLNPEGVLLGIVRMFAYFRTGSTGAANFSAGVGVTGNADTSLCSTMDCIEATVGGKLVFLPAAQAAETASPARLWAAGEYISFTGSATTVGLDADIYIEYIRLA